MKHENLIHVQYILTSARYILKIRELLSAMVHWWFYQLQALLTISAVKGGLPLWYIIESLFILRSQGNICHHRYSVANLCVHPIIIIIYYIIFSHITTLYILFQKWCYRPTFFLILNKLIICNWIRNNFVFLLSAKSYCCCICNRECLKC